MSSATPTPSSRRTRKRGLPKSHASGTNKKNKVNPSSPPQGDLMGSVPAEPEPGPEPEPESEPERLESSISVAIGPTHDTIAPLPGSLTCGADYLWNLGARRVSMAVPIPDDENDLGVSGYTSPAKYMLDLFASRTENAEKKLRDATARHARVSKVLQTLYATRLNSSLTAEQMEDEERRTNGVLSSDDDEDRLYREQLYLVTSERTGFLNKWQQVVDRAKRDLGKYAATIERLEAELMKVTPNASRHVSFCSRILSLAPDETERLESLMLPVYAAQVTPISGDALVAHDSVPDERLLHGVADGPVASRQT